MRSVSVAGTTVPAGLQQATFAKPTRLAISVRERVRKVHHAARVLTVRKAECVTKFAHGLPNGVGAKRCFVPAATQPEKRDDRRTTRRVGDAEDEVEPLRVEVACGDAEHAAPIELACGRGRVKTPRGVRRWEGLEGRPDDRESACPFRGSSGRWGRLRAAVRAGNRTGYSTCVPCAVAHRRLLSSCFTHRFGG